MLGRSPAWLSRPLLFPLLIVAGILPSYAQSARADITPAETGTIPKPSVGIVASERTLLAGSFAAEKLWAWKKRLNLQDWNITVEVTRASQLKPKTLGNVHWDLAKKTAIIRVLDPADYKLSFAPMMQDIECTVVHELVHLEIAPVLADLQRTDANRMEEEHAVNQMVDALLNLDRAH